MAPRLLTPLPLSPLAGVDAQSSGRLMCDTGLVLTLAGWPDLQTTVPRVGRVFSPLLRDGRTLPAEEDQGVSSWGRWGGGPGAGPPGTRPQACLPSQGGLLPETLLTLPPPLQEIRTGLGKRAAGTARRGWAGNRLSPGKVLLGLRGNSRLLSGALARPRRCSVAAGVQGRAAAFIGESERSPGGLWSSDRAPGAPSPRAWL